MYSIVDIAGVQSTPTPQKSNVVVDTIRIISGIPQSRMNDILSETENNPVVPDDDQCLISV